MKSKLIIILALILAGCSKQKTQDFTSHKSVKRDQYQSEACKEMTLNGLLGLNGNDVYYLPRCISGRDENGSLKHFAATNDVMETLGLESIENILDVIKLNPEGGEGLPIMKNLLLFMERGTVVNGKSNKALEDKMFGSFQDFLFEMDPYWVSHLVVQMSQTGTLEQMLDEFAPLVNTIDMQPLFGQMKLFLSEKELKDSFVYAAERVVNTPSLHDSFKEILTFEKSYNLSSDAQNRYLKDWLDPQINDFVEEDIQEIPEKNRIGQLQTGLERYNTFIEDMGQEDISRFTKISSELFKRFAKMDPEGRLSVIKKLFDGFSESFMEQAGPVRNLVALVDFLANKSKVSDLSNVMLGIDELLKGTGPAAILSLNHKVGSAKLHALADRVLLKGGAIPGCNGLQVSGLSGVDTEDFEKVKETISLFVVPNSKCMNGLSPLASLVFSEMESELNITDECQNDLCFQTEDYEQIGARLNSFDWTDLKTEQNVDPTLLKEFVIEALESAKTEVSKDSYALYWDHLSIGAVTQDIIDNVIEMVSAKDSLTARAVADIDFLIETTDPHRRYFHPQFLENLIANKIMKLSATAEQFAGLMSNGEKAERVFSGVYSNGPLEQMIANGVEVPSLGANLQLPKIEFRLKELVSRLKRPGNIFKDSRLDSYEDSLPTKFLGERLRSVQYDFEKRTDSETGDSVYHFKGVVFSKDPIQVTDIFNEDFWRLEELLTSDQLIGKDIPYQRSDEFIDWVENTLYPYLATGKDWGQEAQRAHAINGVDSNYFEVEPYTVSEIRKIAFFYSKNYMMAPSFMPAGAHEIEKVRPKKNSNVKHQFVGLPHHKSVSKWTTFNKYFPGSLESAGSFSDIFKNVSAEQLNSIEWSSLPVDKSGKYELAGFEGYDLEVIKTLSTLNLMTVNRSKEYMPFAAIGDHCYYKGDALRCPITFVDSDKSSAVHSLKNYVQRVAKSFMCPVVNSSDGDFNTMMRSSMQINGISSEVCNSAENLFVSQVELNEQIPMWLHRAVLTDTIKMGRKANLKPGLSTLTARIRYHRLQQKYPRDMEQISQGMSNSMGMLPAGMSAFAFKQMADHKGFLVYQPGYLNVYINFLIKELSATGYSEELLAYYGAGVTVDQDLATGVGQTLLTDVLIGTYNEINNKNVSVLDYVFRVIQKLARPEYKKHLSAIANIVAYPQDLEALSTYTKTIPLLVKHLSTYDLDKTFWQRPGNSLIRHIILHQERMRSLNDLLINFNGTDIRDGLTAVVETFYLLGPAEDINRVIAKGVNFLKNELISTSQDGQGVIQIIENSVRKIMLEDAVDMDFRSVNNVIDAFARSTIGFDGEPAAPMIDQIQLFLEYGVRHAPNLLGLYQSHFEKSKVDEEENYLKTVVNSLTSPLKGLLGDLGSSTMAFFLSNSEFGSWDSLFKPLLFNKKYQAQVLKMVRASDKADLDQYQEMILETEEVLPSTNRYLKYIVKRANWNDESSEYSLESLLRLSGQNNKVLDGQVSLMMKWLETARNNK